MWGVNMQKMYSAKELSKYIINKCTIDEEYISNLQLQKILFYIQEYYLKKEKRAIFADEIYAWQFGPVVPEVYYEFCGYGAMPIYNEYNVEIDNEDRRIIDNIIETKRAMKPWQLVEETHKKNGAWDRVYNQGRGNKQLIPIEYIEEY